MSSSENTDSTVAALVHEVRTLRSRLLEAERRMLISEERVREGERRALDLEHRLALLEMRAWVLESPLAPDPLIELENNTAPPSRETTSPANATNENPPAVEIAEHRPEPSPMPSSPLTSVPSYVETSSTTADLQDSEMSRTSDSDDMSYRDSSATTINAQSNKRYSDSGEETPPPRNLRHRGTPTPMSTPKKPAPPSPAKLPE
ncbi:hypothetical protein FRB99_007480, partial [Tulasnella sp. 403]